MSKKMDIGEFFNTIFSLFLVILFGAFIIVAIITTIKPDFFVKKEGDNSTKIESVRAKIKPKKELPSYLSLVSYELQQKSYYSSSPASFDEPDRFERTVKGKLINKGKTIPAGALHLLFDIYDLNGKKVEGAYCIVDNLFTDIRANIVWEFDAFDNNKDCFPEAERVNLNLEKYVIVYRDYTIE